MNFFKKALILAMATCIAAVPLGFTACDLSQTGSGSGSNAEASDVDILNDDYGFISADEYEPETTTIAETKKYTSLNAGTDYYFILQFDIASREDNKGTSLLTVEIELDDINVMTGTISEANGVTTSTANIDAATGKTGLSYSTSFKIPDKADTPKTVYIVMELIPVTTGNSHIYFKLSAEDFEIYGNDGLTKDLTINAVQLETPVITWNESMLMLSWSQVKYAEYYVIYVDGKLLTEDDGETVVKVEAPSGIAVGSSVLYSELADYITNTHYVSVMACSAKDIFLDSNISDALIVNI